MDEQKPSGFPDFEEGEIIATEVIEHAEPATERTVARRAALQILYEIDSAGHKVGEVIQNYMIHHVLSGRASRYLNRLVLGVVQNGSRLDQIIQQYAPEFPLDQVAIVDRNVLRIALFELGVESDVPMKVAIDEAVQLAKLFGAEGSPRFVNGVLGALTDDYQLIREKLSQETL